MAKYINYVPQIGINRGSGLKNVAGIKQETANSFAKMSEMFANDALNQLKEDGKKFGTETALATKFMDKEVILDGETQPITVPVLAETPEYLGKTASENYENIMYKRYSSDIENQINTIIGTEYQRAVEKNLPPVVIENLLKEKKASYISNLAPRFGELMSLHWESTFQQKGLAYLGVHHTVRVGEHKVISDKALINENDKFHNSLSTQTFYSDEGYISIILERAENGVITDDIAKDTIKQEMAERNFSRGLIREYGISIGLEKAEIDGTSRPITLDNNHNRTELLKLLQTDGIRVEAVTLRGKDGPIIVTRKDIDKLSNGNVAVFKQAEKYLKNNLKISSGVDAKVLKRQNFLAQIKDNIINSSRRKGTHYESQKRGAFQKYSDTIEGKQILVDQYNNRTDRSSGDTEMLTVDNAFDNMQFLESYAITHQTLPESVLRKYKSAITSFDTNVLTEEVWGVLTAPKNLPYSAGFSWKNNYDFNAKEKKSAEIINQALNNGSNITEAVRRASSLSEINLTSNEGKVLQEQLIGQDYFRINEFSTSVDQALTNYLKSEGFEENLGAIYSSVYKKRLLDELSVTGKKITSQEDIEAELEGLMTDDGFFLKYGQSTVSKGFQPKFLNLPETFWYDESTSVALPPEKFYAGENVKVIISGKEETKTQIEIVDINIQNMLRGKTKKPVVGDGLRLMKFGGLHDLIPTNYNYLHNPNLVEDLKSGRLDSPSYYIRYYDENKKIFRYREDANGNVFVIEPKHFKEIITNE